MKLKRGMLTRMIGDTQMMVAADPDVFSGIVRSNETAAFLVERLKEETTEEQLTDALCAEYDVTRSVAAADVADFLAKLREIRVLEE